MPDLLDQLPTPLKALVVLVPVIVLIVVVFYLAGPYGRDLDASNRAGGDCPLDLPSDDGGQPGVAAERKPAGQDRLTREPRTGMGVDPDAPTGELPAVSAAPDDHLSGAQHHPTTEIPAVLPPVPGPRSGSTRAQLPARDPQDPDRETRSARRARQAAEAAAQAQIQRDAKKRR